jgi:hypothetical protein
MPETVVKRKFSIDRPFLGNHALTEEALRETRADMRGTGGGRNLFLLTLILLAMLFGAISYIVLALAYRHAIATLREAREIILALPERTQLHPHWQYAVELLLNAADQGLDLSDASAQLRRALIVEGMLRAE